MMLNVQHLVKTLNTENNGKDEDLDAALETFADTLTDLDQGLTEGLADLAEVEIKPAP